MQWCRHHTCARRELPLRAPCIPGLPEQQLSPEHDADHQKDEDYPVNGYSFPRCWLGGRRWRSLNTRLRHSFNNVRSINRDLFFFKHDIVSNDLVLFGGHDGRSDKSA